jgi:hypothetical protein
MESILAAQEKLRNLPVKEKGKTKKEIVEFLKTDLRKAVKQGHSLKDIHAMLAEQGIIVSLSSMEAVLGKTGKDPARPKARDEENKVSDEGKRTDLLRKTTALPRENESGMAEKATDLPGENKNEPLEKYESGSGANKDGVGAKQATAFLSL